MAVWASACPSLSSLFDLHRGEVRASSDGPGTGATLLVRLPLSNASAELPMSLEKPAVAAASAADGLRVIVVDDEADVRDGVAELLERAGMSVLPLESGASIDEAIASFRPDVLVLDISMPGEDAYSLTRRARRLPDADGGTIPAISLTAHAREAHRRHAMDLGFRAHLAKPVNVAVLLETVRRLAGTRSRPVAMTR